MAHAEGIGLNPQMSRSTGEITSFSLPTGSKWLGPEPAPNFCISEESCHSFPEKRRMILSYERLCVMGEAGGTVAPLLLPSLLEWKVVLVVINPGLFLAQGHQTSF